MILFISFAGFSAYLIHVHRSASLRHIKNVFLPAYGEKLTLQLEELVVPPIEAVCIFFDIREWPGVSSPGEPIAGYLRELMELEALEDVQIIDFFHVDILYTPHKENNWLYYRHQLYDDYSEFTDALLRNLNAGQSVTIVNRNSQLVKLNDEKDLYLSVITHQVNNTLAVLSNELREKINGKNMLMLSWVDSTKRLIANIIMNIKHLSSNQPVPLDETVDLQEHLQFLILRNRDKTELKNQYISLSSCIGPLFIPTNKQVLEEVLENLIDNAVITVCDQGPGFAEQDIGRIFSPFMRLTAKPTGGETTTGLGLYVAYRLTAKLGGTLRLDQDYTGGASFEVTLPLGGSERANLC